MTGKSVGKDSLGRVTSPSTPTHYGGRPHECRECGKKFSRKSTLNTHTLTHTGERPYECRESGKKFNNKSTLKAHTLTHTGEKPHECHECGKKFSTKSHLNTHTLTHTGERPHECKECGKKFTQKSALNRHTLTHTGERPHECKECGKKFTRKSVLNTHTLTHTGERPHECHECGKKFTQKSDLNTHTLTHTGERPHECHECGRKFRYESDLNTHTLTHGQHSAEFSGFEENNSELQNRLLQRRVKGLESDFEVVMKMVSELRREREEDKRKISDLEAREVELRDQLTNCIGWVKVETLNKEQNKWEEKRNDEKVEVQQRVKKLKQKADGGGEMMQRGSVQNFKEIVEEQLEERMSEKVIKENEGLVRGTVILLDIKEEETLSTQL
ncbi:zinc finger protein 157-like isoform X4 [Eriocheir sinensis]|uniref:zinc finger protein 157-like isoform X4 n=1 Tax=Eriocheir sinensis TaxID=95602 RepID=UPI0021C70D62|nr:zinc finger protein 157-like isoform X4 [Eriocheir sinensis]